MHGTRGHPVRIRTAASPRLGVGPAVQLWLELSEAVVILLSEGVCREFAFQLDVPQRCATAYEAEHGARV